MHVADGPVRSSHPPLPSPNASTVGRPTTVSVRYLDGSVAGPRVVESRVSPLRAFAGPWPEMLTLLPQGFPASSGVYLLTRPSGSGAPRVIVRPGEANDLRRRLNEHALDPTKSEFTEIFAVCAVDDRLSKSDCRYVEARLHELVVENGAASLEVDRIPALQSAIHGREDLESLLDQSRLLLHAAGCLALDAQHVPTLLTEEKEEGVVEVTGEILGGINDEHELTYDNMWARGYPTTDGWIVRAGSDVRRRENMALLPTVASRRRMLLDRGVLGSIPGVGDRWRLMTDVFCSSALLAAKIVSGAHVSSKGIWQRISPSARMVVAK